MPDDVNQPPNDDEDAADDQAELLGKERFSHAADEQPEEDEPERASGP